jgi:hypothetical protein
MKLAKGLIWFVAGAAVMFTTQIYGAGLLTGEKVDNQMNVKVNDKLIGSAAVIEGTSYVPVRAIANELNMDVTVSGSDINLTTAASTLTKIAQQEEADAKQKEQKAGALESKKKILQNDLDATTAAVQTLKTKTIPDLEKGTSSTDRTRLDIAKKNLARLEQKLVDLNTQMADLNSQIQAAKAE